MLFMWSNIAVKLGVAPSPRQLENGTLIAIAQGSDYTNS